MPSHRSEVQRLIAQYKTDIAVLEERENDLMRRIEILENLIPTVLVWYMWKMAQASKSVPFPQSDTEEEAAKKLFHLETVLEELQEADKTLKEEEKVMRKRIEELEVSLSTEPFQIYPEPSRPRLGQAVIDSEIAEKEIKIKSLEEKRAKFKDLLADSETDWQKTCEDLFAEVNELSENLNKANEKLKESEKYIEQLEEDYLKKEQTVQEKIHDLEKQADYLLTDYIDKERERNDEEEIKDNKMFMVMQETIQELDSIKESITLKGLITPEDDGKKPLADKVSKDGRDKKSPLMHTITEEEIEEAEINPDDKESLLTYVESKDLQPLVLSPEEVILENSIGILRKPSISPPQIFQQVDSEPLTPSKDSSEIETNLEEYGIQPNNILERLSAELTPSQKGSETPVIEVAVPSELSKSVSAEQTAPPKLSETPLDEETGPSELSEILTIESPRKSSETSIVEVAGPSELSKALSEEPTPPSKSETPTVDESGPSELSKALPVEPTPLLEPSETPLVEPTGTSDLSKVLSIEPTPPPNLSETPIGDESGPSELSKALSVELTSLPKSSDTPIVDESGPSKLSKVLSEEPTALQKLSEAPPVGSASPLRVSNVLLEGPTSTPKLSKPSLVEPLSPSDELEVVPEEAYATPVSPVAPPVREAADGVEAHAITSEPFEVPFTDGIVLSPTPSGLALLKEPGMLKGRPSVDSLAAQTLQSKCRVKDHLIKSMADQLRELARNNVWSGSKLLETVSTDPVKTYDFDRTTLAQYLKGEEPKDLVPSLRIFFTTCFRVMKIIHHRTHSM